MKGECCAYIDAEASIRFPFRNKLQMLIETLGANLEKILDPRVVPTCLVFISRYHAQITVYWSRIAKTILVSEIDGN